MTAFVYYWLPRMEQAAHRLVNRMTRITWNCFGCTADRAPYGYSQELPVILFEPTDGEAVAAAD